MPLDQSGAQLLITTETNERSTQATRVRGLIDLEWSAAALEGGSNAPILFTQMRSTPLWRKRNHVAMLMGSNSE